MPPESALQKRIDEHSAAVAEALSDLPASEQFAVISHVLFRFFARGPDKGRMEFYVKFFGELTTALCRHGFLDEEQLGNRMQGGKVQ